MKWKIVCLFFLLQFLGGCGLREREEDIIRREALLEQKEQALLRKENELILLEAELQNKQQQADSTQLDTTTFKYPEILGPWNVIMVCVETSCPGSAVGDTKLETWYFTYEQNHLMVKAMVGDKIVRMYRGNENEGKPLELTTIVEGTETIPATKIVVRLIPVDKSTMNGQRIIIRESGCRIVYDLKLTR